MAMDRRDSPPRAACPARPAALPLPRPARPRWAGPRLPPAPRPASLPRRAVLRRRIRLLVAATITYNVVEAIIAIVAGTAASSGALVGVGLGSLIRVRPA